MARTRLASVLMAATIALLTVGCAEIDPGITTAVKARLAADDQVSTYTIDVETNDRVVTLSGEVDSPAARDRALGLARNTDGVREVIDKLSVAPGATPTSGDAGRVDGQATRDEPTGTAQGGSVTASAVLTSKVKTRLLADTSISGLKIDVESRDGVVTLTGTVSSEAEKTRALRIARETDGVTSVVDKLKVGS